jgi:hypothetical protein
MDEINWRDVRKRIMDKSYSDLKYLQSRLLPDLQNGTAADRIYWHPDELKATMDQLTAEIYMRESEMKRAANIPRLDAIERDLAAIKQRLFKSGLGRSSRKKRV